MTDIGSEAAGVDDEFTDMLCSKIRLVCARLGEIISNITIEG